MEKVVNISRKPVFLIASLGFLLLVLIQVIWLQYTYQLKKKEFTEKVTYSLRFFNNDFQKSKELEEKMLLLWSNEDRVAEVQQDIRFSVDTFFTKQNIPISYVFGIGKSKEKPFWVSNLEYEQDLATSDLSIIALCQSSLGYMYVSFFFPNELVFILSELTPLLALSGFTFLVLGFCFINLAYTLKHQRKLSKLKNDFINNMTHELKTPLFTISIASKVLGEHQAILSSDKLKSYVATMQQETGRLNSLIDKVLQTASLEKDHVQLQMKKLELHAIIHEAVHGFELIREQRKGEIQLQLGAVNSYIEADEVHIFNMIFNLLDNAFKYSKNTPVVVVATHNQGSRLLLSIKDNGVGMDDETKQFLFERFFRAHTGDVHNVKGYGIGLSYVRSVVEAHKGKITIQSRLGAGSEFILNLPQFE